jgi:bifunctional UDP-N-acetylglucosamine pyrophosphorylase/glucosamine-1-phosphate N-acetyltransferase
MSLEVIILAAGKGKRMQSDLPKVLHTLAGRPLISHVLETAKALKPQAIHVVCSRDSESVQAATSGDAVRWVVQAEQRGTGHAVQQALPGVSQDALVLVMYADVPLVRCDTLRAVVNSAGEGGLSLLTAIPDDPTGYGRILRDSEGRIEGIVEERDATDDQRAISEVNTGFLAAPAQALGRWLARVSNQNDQNEFYLTDVAALANQDNFVIHGVVAPTKEEVLGVNSRQELALLERLYQRHLAEALMIHGVTVIDPDRLDIRGKVTAGRDCVLDINVVLEGAVDLGDRVTIGPNNVIRNASIDDDVVVLANCVIEQASIGAGARIGPFARIRPGAAIEEQVHVGNFVEIKNSELRAGAKVNHLSYVGDTTVGRNTNIGAGVITCNYDGARKHRTEIGDDVFVGSNSQLVAPVTIEQGATVGAGSTITSDVPERTLAITRARQRHVSGWRRPRKDTKR